MDEMTMHKWELLERWPHVTKHRCHCGCVKVVTSMGDQFPRIRYTLLGAVYEKAPKCVKEVA